VPACTVGGWKAGNGVYDVLQQIGVLAAGLGLPGQTFNTQNMPSYKTMTDAQILQHLLDIGEVGGLVPFGGTPGQRGAQHWLTGASQSPRRLYGCSPPGSCWVPSWTGTLSKADVFLMRYYMDVPSEIAKSRAPFKDACSPKCVKDAMKQFLLAMEAVCDQIDKDDINFPGVSVAFYPSNALDRMFEEVASAQTTLIAVGCAIMFVFTVAIQFSRHRVTNLSIPAAICFVLVLLSNVAAFGLLAVCDGEFNTIQVQVLPFLALGLGVDDLFILLAAYREAVLTSTAPVTERTDDVMGETLAHAGSAITITSACNAGIFFCGIVVPIPALQKLMLGAGVIIIFNYLTAVVLFPMVLSYWTDCSEPPTAASDVAPELIVGKVYGYLAKSWPAKLVALGFGFGLLAVSIAAYEHINYNYELQDFAKKGSYLAKGIETMDSNILSQHQTNLMIYGPGVDYPKKQALLLDTFEDIVKSTYACSPGAMCAQGGISFDPWINTMLSTTGICEPTVGKNLCNASEFMEQFNIWRVPTNSIPATCEPSTPPTNTTPVDPPGTWCVGPPRGLSFGSLVAQTAKQVNVFGYRYGADESIALLNGYPSQYSYFSSNTIMLSFDSIELDMQFVQTTDDKINMVNSFKQILGATGQNIFMYGWLYTQVEQFLELESYFWQSVAISMAVIFSVSVLLSLSWVGAGLTTFLSTIVLVELYGWCAIADIYIQAPSAASLLMSLGIAVEFIVHPIAAYEFATGTRDERVATAMKLTAKPVFEGGVSSFLGVLMMAFSDFDYVRKYYFAVFSLNIFLGLANALVLLPALLGVIGSDRIISPEGSIRSSRDAKPPSAASSTSAGDDKKTYSHAVGQTSVTADDRCRDHSSVSAQGETPPYDANVPAVKVEAVELEPAMYVCM